MRMHLLRTRSAASRVQVRTVRAFPLQALLAIGPQHAQLVLLISVLPQGQQAVSTQGLHLLPLNGFHMTWQ